MLISLRLGLYVCIPAQIGTMLLCAPALILEGNYPHTPKPYSHPPLPNADSCHSASASPWIKFEPVFRRRVPRTAAAILHASFQLDSSCLPACQPPRGSRGDCCARPPPTVRLPFPRRMAALMATAYAPLCWQFSMLLGFALPWFAHSTSLLREERHCPQTAGLI